MFELNRNEDAVQQIATSIADLPKRLNIGCGYDKRPGYLNVDVDPACEPDILVVDHNLSALPDNYFDEVLAHDVLEHIPHPYTMYALLDWSALLRTGGALSLSTSSIFGVIDVMRSQPNFETEYNWTRCLFGSQQHAGDFHHCGFTDRTLRVFLSAAGFEVPLFTLVDGWIMQCTVRKLESWTDLLSLSGDALYKAAFERFLFRSIPEESLNIYRKSEDDGVSRRDMLRTIVASPEHLYKLGAMFDASTASGGQAAR